MGWHESEEGANPTRGFGLRLPLGGFVSAAHSELRDDLSDMVLRSIEADIEAISDLGIGQPFAQ